ncbi:MAG TPA: protoporphyrinogen oxidase [Gemmataceae bacterium]|nr:protoporphyrinogen oxidase [Gemmataceae bacterium]
MPRVVIVGAGISGLAVAYRLQQLLPAAQITILEQRERPGGTVWTERQDGFQVETGPNGFLDTKPATLNLCRDLGLGERLVPASEAAGKNRYLFLDGKLKPLPGGLLSFLATDLLSWRGKLGLFLERFRRPRQDDRDESIDAFARRRAGREAAEVFADALVTGIYAGDPTLLSLPATFPRLAALEREHGSVLKGLGQAARERRAKAKANSEAYQRPGRMWSFREGLRLLIETLQGRLDARPLFGVDVRQLSTEEGPEGRPIWVVSADGRDSWTADAVVLACPAYRQAGLLAEVDRELAEEVAGIAYNRIAVVALGYRREDVPGGLNGFGFIAPQRARCNVLGVQWCSSIYPDRAAAGTVLLRAMCGGWHRAEVAGYPDERLLEVVRAELAVAMGVRAAPLFHRIIRWDRAIPQYHLGHLERVARIEACAARYPGLFLAGNAYHGVALNDCTERGEILATRIHDYFTSPHLLRFPGASSHP